MSADLTISRLTTLFTDSDGDGIFDFGDVLLTRIRLTNVGTSTATDLSVTDTLSGVTLQAGSVKVTPIAFDDPQSAVTGNTPIVISKAALLGNDVDPDGAEASLSITAITAATNGTAIDNGDGTITFIPTTGFQGTASFQYSITDAQGLSSVTTGTVTIPVSNLAWYVDSNYAGGNGASDGSYLRPFTSFAQLNGVTGDGTTNDDVDGANNIIFVYNRGSAYTGGITLESGQHLYGDGHELVINGMSIGAAGQTAGPTINHSTYGITLADANTVRGLTLNGTATTAEGIRDGGASVGSLFIDKVSVLGAGKAVDIDQGGTLNVSIDTLSSLNSASEGVHLQGVSGSFSAAGGTIQTPTGTGFLIGASGGAVASSGGDANITYAGAITSPGVSLVEVQDRTGGTVSFSGNLTEGNITSGQTGILIDGNSGAISFTGQLFISSGGSAGTGVSITNSSGSVNFNATGTGLDITVANGTGLNWVNGGTLTIQGTGNSISASTGRLFIGQNGVIGTSGITFASMMSNGNVLTGPTILLSNIDKVTTGSFNGGSVSFLQNITSDALQISNGSSADASFTGFSTLNIGAGNDAIEISGSSGTYTFGGNVTINAGAGNGIRLVDNTGGSTSFTGGNLNLDTTSGTGLFASDTVTGRHSLTISGSTNSIAATTGRAIYVDNLVSNLTLRDVTTTTGGTDTSVYLRNTGSSGQFVITGSASTAGSGGTLASRSGTDGQTTTGNGIYFENAYNISLSNLIIGTTGGTMGNYGIQGSSVTNFTLRDSEFRGVFGTAGTEGGVRFAGLAGTALLEGNVIGGGYLNNLAIVNTAAGSLNLTIRDSVSDQAVFGQNGATTGIDSVYLEMGGGGTTNLLIDGVSFTGGRTSMLDARLIGGTGNFTLQNNSFANAQANGVANQPGVLIVGDGTGTNLTYNVSNNLFSASNGRALIVNFIPTSGSAQGLILNNTFGTDNGVFDATVGGGGMAVFHGPVTAAGGSATHAVRIEGNNIRDYTINGIQLTAHDLGSGTARFEATVRNNVMEEVAANAGGLHLWTQNSAKMGVVIQDNVINLDNASGSDGIGNAIFIQQDSNTSELYVPGYVPGATGNRGEFVGGTASTQLSSFWTSAPYNNILTNGVTPGVPGSGVDARNADNISGSAFVLPVPMLAAASQGAAGWEALRAGSSDASPPALPGNLAFASFTHGGLSAALLNSAFGWSALTMAGSGATSGSIASIGLQHDWLLSRQPVDAVASHWTQAGAFNLLAGLAGLGRPFVPVPQPVIVDDGTLTQGELDAIVDAAIQRWIAAGATPEQVEAMRAVDVNLVDMLGSFLGASEGAAISIDDDAAGHGWFVDSTPFGDSEFEGVGTVLSAGAGGAAAGKMDLLTVVMHELGHQIGLDDVYQTADADELMYGYAKIGERRLPEFGEALAARPGSVVATAFALAPVAIGGLPAGKTVDIYFNATVNAQSNQLITNLSNTATVTGSNVTTGTANENNVVDGLALGSHVWADANGNNAFNAGEGVSGVALTLFADSNGSGTLDAGDAQLATTTSGAGGLYSFTGIAPGNYIVRVDAANFSAGGALSGRATLSGSTDPDDNVDNDDNGVSGPSGSIVSGAITLSYNNEPTPGTGNDTNNTLDFGFMQANVGPTIDLDGDDSEAVGTGFASSYVEGGSAAAIGDTDVMISDPDVGDDLISATITITNPVAGDILNVGTLPATITVDPSSSNTVIRLVAAPGTSKADFEAALEAITFSSTSNDPTNGGTNQSRSISVVVNDGESNSNTAVATVAVTSVNDAPVNSLGGTIGTGEDAIDAWLSGMSISDPDAGGDDIRVTFSVGNGTLDIRTDVIGGITAADVVGDDTGTITVIATLSQINATLAATNGLTYTPTTNFYGDDMLTVVTNDQGAKGTDPGISGDGASEEDTDIRTISVSAANDSPVVTASGPAAATEQTASSILVGATVSDVDLDARNGGNGDYAGAVFSVNRNPSANAQDDFSLVAGANFTIDGISLKAGGLIFGHISTDANGAFAVTFTSLETIATSALVDQVIQAIRYTNVSNSPPSSVTLAVGFSDGSPGGGQGSGATGLDVELVTVNIAGVNDAPVNSLGGMIGTGEDAIDAWLSGMSISDPDANPASDEIVVIFNVGNGTLDIRTDVAGGITAADVTGDDTGTITVTATLNQINATLAATNGLTYSPNANFNGDDTLTVTTNDQGHNGSDPGLTGDGSSEQDVDTRTIVVSAQDDAPVAQPDAVSTAENQILSGGAGSLFANNGSGTDSDADGDPLQIAEVQGSGANVGVEITLASGAKLTVNANGSYSYNPNGKFNYLTDSSSGAANTSAEDSFTYTLAGGNTVTVTITVNGVAGTGDQLRGSVGGDIVTGTAAGDTFMLQQGGNDTANGLAGNDIFYFGGAFTPGDTVNADVGNDVLVLQGDYSGGVTFGAGGISNITGVEYVSLQSGEITRWGDTAFNFYDYHLIMLDSNVAAGEQFRVNGQSLRAGEDLTFNGSAETDGRFLIYGGHGVDALTGGAGNDIFFFETTRFGSSDTVNGGGGADALVISGEVGPITIRTGQMTSIESLSFNARFSTDPSATPSYNVTMENGNIAFGATLVVNASSLAGNQTLNFNGLAETNGRFSIFGGAGADTLTGGSGNDGFYAAGGADQLMGGNGSDSFQYRSTADSIVSAQDQILDFVSGTDKLDLQFIDAIASSGANDAFTFIGASAFSGNAGELRATQNAGVWTVQADVNGDGQADLQISVTASALTSGDFIL